MITDHITVNKIKTETTFLGLLSTNNNMKHMKSIEINIYPANITKKYSITNSYKRIRSSLSPDMPKVRKLVISNRILKTSIVTQRQLAV